MEHRYPRSRLQQLQPGYRHGEDGGHAPTVTRRSLLRNTNQREQRLTAGRGQLHQPGSNLTRATKIDDEVVRWISKDSQAFGRLQSTVWYRRGLRLNTKQKRCKAIILRTLLNTVETWTVYKKQARTLNHYHLSCFRWILKLRWQDRIPDTGVPERTGILSINVMLRQLRMRWRGHLARMDDERLRK
ncbi:hypothetical protein SprV_0100420900 [Sparganum proliferum]